jgi:large subunit ribosomal protein L3
MPGLIGRKIGMTQVFEENGTVVPVTVLALGPCPVVQVKTLETDGYAAVQLAYDKVIARKITKPQRGHLESKQLEPHRVLREFRTEETLEPGAVLDVSLFAPGDRVDVVGTDKGRGFQGTRRRHHFRGGPETHGCKTHDQPGSVGASAWPSHVIKGRKLPGHMGDSRVTALNLKVVRIDQDRNLLLVRGAVPGGRHSLVLVRKTRRVLKKG